MTLQSKPNTTSGQRGFPYWMNRFALLIGFGALFYYGYCFGLWGRSSLLLQYIFQCGCPRITEEMRYPKQVDIVAPACGNIGTRISPSGRMLFVYEKIDRYMSVYILDLLTNEKTLFSLPESKIYFLNDNLLYVFVWFGGDYEGGDYVFDRTTNTMYPIQKFVYARPGSYVNGNADQTKLVEALRGVRDVYYIKNERLIVALPHDFINSQELAFLSGSFDLPYNGDVNRVEPFLQENDISYKYIPANFPGEVVSPDGRFIARRDGIYLSESDQRIVDGYTFSWYYRSYSGKYLSLRGWKYDGSGAIYSQVIGPCLLEFGLPFMDGPGCFVEVPQPIILLKVPEEYLLSTPTPR